MGIDLLDVSFRIEQQLGVFISADDWHEMVDDGDIRVQTVYDCVLAGTQVKDEFRTNISLNRSLWERLQSAVVSVTGRSLEDIQLHSRVHDIFGGNQPTDTIRKIGEVAALRMPSRDLTFFGCLFALTCIAWASWLLCIEASFGQIGILLCLLFAVLMLLASPGWNQNHLPCSVVTMKDFYRSVRDCNYLRFRYCAGELVDDEEVFRKLRSVLVDALGVDDDEVTLEARLVADLGCC